MKTVPLMYLRRNETYLNDIMHSFIQDMVELITVPEWCCMLPDRQEGIQVW